MVVHRLHRGEVNKPREPIEPAFPAALTPAGGQPELTGIAPHRRRAALAQWLTSTDNPLVPRVLVNRVWGWHFGRAIVRTPNDFGAQGEPPTHPELLDFLSSELIEHSWSLKHLHRLILLSSTYRMSSMTAGPGLEADPENLWLWHFPRRRLEGEAIRDAMLAAAGRLNAKPFGKPVVPPLGKEELTGLFDAKGKWPVTKEAAEHTRRSVYLLVRRTFVYPMFSAFDPPGVMASCGRRIETVVPTQALALLNSPLAGDQAAAFARRIVADSRGEPGEAVSRAWLLAFGRRITLAERARALEFLNAGATSGSPSGDSTAPAVDESALAELCLALFNANEFIYID
jgi:hypothetical protein